MFRHRRQLRLWAVRLLLAWLFGMGAGVANACLVAGAAELGAHLQTNMEADSHHEQVPGKSNCQDFCEKSAVSMCPMKSVLDDVHGPALPPSALAVVLEVPAPLPDPVLLPRRDGVLAHPPITITLLRLAL